MSSPAPTCVLLAAADPTLADALSPLLSSAGCSMASITNSRALYISLLQKPADILLLSEDLPEEGGLAVVRQLRSIRSTAEIGILVLCRSGSEGRLASLQAGADAALAFPLAADEVLAHVQALARRLCRSAPPEANLYWQYHQNEWKLVSPSGADIGLSHLEAAFVHMIARQPGRPVRRRDIIALGFGQDPLHYDHRRLEALVSRLRKKVHRCYPLSQPIKVVHSIGYMFSDAIRCFEVTTGDNPADKSCQK